MDLDRLAQELDYGGKRCRVVDDAGLLKWSRERDLPPGRAPVEALERGIVPLRYLKNLWSLDLDEQRRICQGRVFVCGCGGLGGGVLQNLARAGVGMLRFADGDAFTDHNLNRQWFSDVANLGRPKAKAAAERIAAINPFVRVEPFSEVLVEENAERLTDGVHVAVDALDNLEARFALAKASERLSIPFVHGAIAGWLGQVATFPPGASVSLEAVYGNRRSRDESELAVGVLGPTASVIGSIQAQEVLRLLVGRPAAYAGKLLYFEGGSGMIEILPLATE
jgi:molybdopterin/thiamine biosynthesis adenylyltransferase